MPAPAEAPSTLPQKEIELGRGARERILGGLRLRRAGDLSCSWGFRTDRIPGIGFFASLG